MSLRFILAALCTLLVCAYAERSCSLGRYGTLSSYSQEKRVQLVVLPCKYQLADMQCGGNRVRVTVGSQLEADNGKFSPNMLKIRVDDPETERFWRGKTDAKRLGQYADSAADKVWKKTDGSLTGLTVTYDPATKAAVIENEGKFKVTFRDIIQSGDEAGVTVTCFDDADFLSSGHPASLCGNGEVAELVQRRLNLSSSLNFRQTVSFDILNYTSVVQNSECQDLAESFQDCSDQLTALNQCNGLVERPEVAKSLTKDDDTLVDNYLQCLSYFCTDDKQACSDLRTSVTKHRHANLQDLMMANFPFLNDC